MTAGDRRSLVMDAARSIAATRDGATVDDLLSDGGRLDLLDAAEFAIDGALSALYPREAAALEAARHAFDDRFNAMEAAVRDVTFAIGVAYGRLIAKAEAER
jgi:hypothetical protein